MDVLQQAVAAVTAGVAGLRFDAIRRARPNTLGDAELTVHTGKDKHVFRVEVKRGILTSAALPALETLLIDIRISNAIYWWHLEGRCLDETSWFAGSIGTETHARDCADQARPLVA